MTPGTARAVTSVLTEPQWLWTWSGVCVGYRSGDSLFGCNGREIGHFYGTEIYGWDGEYLGELRDAYDGMRLTTSSYKKAHMQDGFVPAIGRAYKRPKDRVREPLFCGYENFPLPDDIRSRSALDT